MISCIRSYKNRNISRGHGGRDVSFAEHRPEQDRMPKNAPLWRGGEGHYEGPSRPCGGYGRARAGPENLSGGRGSPSALP